MAKGNRHFLIVMTEAEHERWLEVVRRARSRDATLKYTEVNRRLLGLLPPDKLVTKEDMVFFQGRTNANSNSVVAREGKPVGRKGASKGKKRVNGEDEE